MKTKCIPIYGKTCSGKSTLGKQLSSILGCDYISFGDLKRNEIARSTNKGLAIHRITMAGNPIPANLAYSVIKDKMGSELSILSGYPISLEELEIMSADCDIIGTVILNIDETVLLSRFNSRRECPECHLPGKDGDVCPVHGVIMTRRPDVSLDQLAKRRELYRNRILPFLQSMPIIGLPQLELNSGILDEKEILEKTQKWLRYLLATAGKEEAYVRDSG